LTAKNHLTASQVRNVVALERVETSVRQIKSMVHVLPPLLHEEIDILTGNQHESESGKSYAERVEQERMRRRLEASAALVPMDAVSRRRALDLGNINKLINKLDQVSVHEDVKESETGFNPYLSKNPRAPNRRSGAISKVGSGPHKKKTMMNKNGSLAAISSRGDCNDVDDDFEILEKKFIQAIRDEYRNRTLLTSGILNTSRRIGGSRLNTPFIKPLSRSNTGASTASANAAGRQTASSRKQTPIDMKTIESLPVSRGADEVGEKYNKEINIVPFYEAADSLTDNQHDSQQIQHAAAVADNAEDYSTLLESNTNKNAKALTTRFLLPFYKIDDVRKFVDIFTKVDEDFSG
jgi:hypothetical protein